MSDERDKIVTDPIEPLDPLEPRTSTRKTTAEMELYLDEIDHMAEFHEWFAASLRKAKATKADDEPIRVRLRITVE